MTPSEMVFSDDDLKRLKEEAYDYRDGSRFQWVKGPEILALLSRLEAAENVCEFHYRDGFKNGERLSLTRHDAPLIEAWRKSTGRGGV